MLNALEHSSTEAELPLLAESGPIVASAYDPKRTLALPHYREREA